MKLTDIHNILVEDLETDIQDLETKFANTRQKLITIEREWDKEIGALKLDLSRFRINKAIDTYKTYKKLVAGTGKPAAAAKIYNFYQEHLRSSTDAKEQQRIWQHLHAIERSWDKLGTNVWLPRAYDILLLGKSIDANKNLLKAAEEYVNLEALEKKLKTALSKKRKEVGQEMLSAGKGKEVNIVPVDPANIPERIKTPLKSSLDNPYLKYTKDRYAGPPSGFKWNRHLKSYVIISKALKRNNLPAIDNVYAGSKSFIATAGDSILWQRREGQMSSRNWLYVKGLNATINVPTFIEQTEQEQDKMIQGK